jgi:hypothetical protein
MTTATTLIHGDFGVVRIENDYAEIGEGRSRTHVPQGRRRIFLNGERIGETQYLQLVEAELGRDPDRADQ